MKRLIATLLIFAFTGMPENSMAADVKSSVEVPESKLETITHQIGQRRYHVRTPPSWDARSPLPVLLHFHGWGRNGQQVLRNRRIADAAAQHGFLLLAPDARGRSFDFWASDSEDIAFTDDMVEDLADRYPIDESSILVSGFSWGGAMA